MVLTCIMKSDVLTIEEVDEGRGGKSGERTGGLENGGGDDGGEGEREIEDETQSPRSYMCRLVGVCLRDVIFERRKRECVIVE